VRLLPAPFFGETRQFGAYFRQALAAIGIEAELVNNDTPGHIKAVYADHAFDLSVGPPVYRGDPAISTTVLAQGGLPAGVPFTNQGGYRDDAMDALIARAAATLDEAARTELYREFQRKVVADLPFINVAEWGFTTVASRKAHNLDTNPRWPVSNWADVWLDA
jgi:peptide/nickel transport system substrate-binding protein